MNINQYLEDHEYNLYGLDKEEIIQYLKEAGFCDEEISATVNNEYFLAE